MASYSNDIQRAFNISKVSYKLMDELLGVDSGSYCVQPVHVYIDLATIIGFMKRDQYQIAMESLINAKDVNTIALEIINVVGHYRNYFKSITDSGNYQLKVFLIYGENNEFAMDEGFAWNKERSEKMNEVYGEERAKRLSRMIDFAMEKRVKEVLRYSRDTYVITSDKFDRSIIPAYIEHSIKEEEVQPLSVFITNAPIFLQFPINNPKSIILQPSGQYSKTITRSNIKSYLTDSYKTSKVESVDSKFILDYLALTGCGKMLEPLTTEIKGVKLLNFLAQNDIDNHAGIDKVSLEKYRNCIAYYKILPKILPEDLMEIDSQIAMRRSSFNTMLEFNEEFFQGNLSLNFFS